MKKPLIVFCLLLIASTCFAANHYVRPDISVDATNGVQYNGDGSTWAAAAGDGQTGAYKNLPATLIRGDTYYLSDGTFGTASGYIFDDPEDGELYIYIKKATVSDHGTEAGWNSALGDGYAQYVKIILRDGYYSIDGNRDGNFGSGNYGIYAIADSATNYPVYLDNQSGDPDNHHVTLKNIYIDPTASRTCLTGSDTKGLYNEFRDILVDDIQIFEAFGDAINVGTANNSTFQNMYINRRGTLPDGCSDHSDAMVFIGGENVTVRNNIFLWDGQIFWFSDSTASSPTNPHVVTNYKIYGNIISGDKNTGGQGICCKADEIQFVGMKIYNNTFIDLPTQSIETPSLTAFPSTGDIRNNIFFNTAAPVLRDGTNAFTHNYNAYESGILTDANGQILSASPFTTYSDDDDGRNDVLTLSAATDAGDSSIGSDYNTDMLGNTRSADGVWDRGAYEYSSSVTTIPQGVHVGGDIEIK